MDKTGIGLIDILALVAILLPLVPIFIIFISQAYSREVFALLTAFCIVTFIQNLILYIPKFTAGNSIFLKAFFQLSQFIIILFLLKMSMPKKWLQEGTKILLVAFVSMVITIY